MGTCRLDHELELCHILMKGPSQSNIPGSQGMEQPKDLRPEAVKSPGNQKQPVNFPGELPLHSYIPLLACAFLQSCNP